MNAPLPAGQKAPRPRARRIGRWLFGVVLLVGACLSACSSFGYQLQAVAGGAGILARRVPIERVLERSDLSARERAQLELVRALRDFSVAELGLPDNGSYRSYVRLGRDVVTWNVVAAPPLSVEPVTWCFPVAGCVSYRGYFRERSARKYAAKLAGKGKDVTVTGAVAYSTLGWFDDPVLDTFLGDEPWRVAALLFHELAHQVVYAPDDTAFNESFATAVEELGVERWLATRGDEVRERERADVERARKEERVFRSLLLDARAQLAVVYASAASEPERLERKRATLERLSGEIAAALEDGRLGVGYEPWRGHAWNNADLAAVADYTLWVPALRALFEKSGGFPAFYAAARELADLEAGARRQRLEAMTAGEENLLPRRPGSLPA